MATIESIKTVFQTEWFDLVEKKIRLGSKTENFYVVCPEDYVSIIAINSDNEILLVEQYRAAVEGNTWELPGGHVEQGEEPEAAAIRELLEETGYLANTVELLGDFCPDTARLGNKMWCYISRDIQRQEGADAEDGIEVHQLTLPSFKQAICEGKLQNALNLTAIGAAMMRSKLEF